MVQESLKTYAGTEISPGFDKQNDKELDEIIRNKSETDLAMKNLFGIISPSTLTGCFL